MTNDEQQMMNPEPLFENAGLMTTTRFALCSKRIHSHSSSLIHHSPFIIHHSTIAFSRAICKEKRLRGQGRRLRVRPPSRRVAHPAQANGKEWVKRQSEGTKP
jgi:hypothetical protein